MDLFQFFSQDMVIGMECGCCLYVLFFILFNHSEKILKDINNSLVIDISSDSNGNVLSTSGPLLIKDLNPNELDYDNYWDEDVKAHLDEFVLLSKAEYEELLKKAGFFIQETQRSIFEVLNPDKYSS